MTTKTNILNFLRCLKLTYGIVAYIKLTNLENKEMFIYTS